MTKLILYIDPKLKDLALRASPLVYPLWERRAYDTVSFGGAFTRHPFDVAHYQSTGDPDACDVHFWPFNYWATLKSGHKEKVDAAYAFARTHGKKLLIDAFGDTMDTVPYEDATVLRFAQYRRYLKENDIIIPAYIEDLLETYREGSLSIRKKNKKPSVGFAGWGRLPFWKHVRSYIKEAPVFLWSFIFRRDGVFRKGVFLRAQALSVLSRSSRVETNFLIRKSYSGNVRTAEKSTEELRREFVDNIDHTDCTLCQKGDANQSTRVFEVFSMGRIPLIIDTECVFPLENKISYKDFCIFVNNTDIQKTADILADTYAHITEEQFEYMQRKARETYEKYLRIDSFTPFLMEEIRRRL